MDSSESISLSRDTTTDSIDVTSLIAAKQQETTTTTATTPKSSNLCSPRKKIFLQKPEQEQQEQRKHLDKERFQRRLTIFESDTHRYKHKQQTILLNAKTNNNLNYYDEETIAETLPPEKEIIIVDDTPPPSATTSTTTITIATSSQHQPQQQNNNHAQSTSSSRPQTHHYCQPASSSASTSSLNTFMTCCSEYAADVATPPPVTEGEIISRISPSPGKKSVLFDRVTVYHFNRSQGFTSVPSHGGSTLGMKRKHFLRRRLTVDMYEEVRRRSRRQILLKMKRDERQQQQQQQQRLNHRFKEGCGPATSMASNASNNLNVCGPRDDDDDDADAEIDVVSDTNGDNGAVSRILVGDKNVARQDEGNEDDDDEDEDDSFSDVSDISDSELEGDNYIFLPRIDIKLRRSLLKASGVCRIDPIEKKDCNKIRESRQRSGCKCVGQCIPEYCECSRLGVKCHVDRASYPCGCNSEGCKNPEGRTEFDAVRVRKHFEEKIFECHLSSDSQSNDEELLTTTPTSSTSSEESC